MEGPVLNTTSLYLVQNSTENEDNLINITQENELNSNSGSERAAEIKRLIYVSIFPFLIIFGSIGNSLTFIVMRRGSMKHVSTCFYMAILALADIGKMYSYFRWAKYAKYPYLSRNYL